MYVDNAVFKMAAEAVRQDGHKACEHDQTDVCVLQQAVSALPYSSASEKSLRRSTSEIAALRHAQSYAFRLDEITERNLSVFDLARLLCVNERLQVRAAARKPKTANFVIYFSPKIEYAENSIFLLREGGVPLTPPL